MWVGVQGSDPEKCYVTRAYCCSNYSTDPNPSSVEITQYAIQGHVNVLELISSSPRATTSSLADHPTGPTGSHFTLSSIKSYLCQIPNRFRSTQCGNRCRFNDSEGSLGAQLLGLLLFPHVHHRYWP